MATNGTPSPAQAPKSVDAKPVVTDEVQRVFKSFDANGDGKISVSELGNVLKALGSSVSADELQRVMGNLDTDRDGFICLDEFNAFWVSGSKDGNAAELCDAFRSLRPGPQRLHLGQRAPFGAQSTPTNAVWLCAAIGLLFGLPILKLDVAFTAFISVSTIGWVGSYAVPIFARLVMAEENFKPGPFYLGRASRPVCLVAFLWKTKRAKGPASTFQRRRKLTSQNWSSNSKVVPRWNCHRRIISLWFQAQALCA